MVVRVWPSSGVPEITGAAVFAGACASTSSVAAEAAESEPPSLLAVTSTRIVEPTSGPTSSYVGAVAPTMSTQFAPAASQRRHWYA